MRYFKILSRVKYSEASHSICNICFEFDKYPTESVLEEQINLQLPKAEVFSVLDLKELTMEDYRKWIIAD